MNTKVGLHSECLFAQAPRILFMRAFAQYFEGKPSGLNPVNIIRTTPNFVNLCEKINETVKKDFLASGEYVKVSRPDVH